VIQLSLFTEFNAFVIEGVGFSFKSEFVNLDLHHFFGMLVGS
jgi:hypothetical protein